MTATVRVRELLWRVSGLLSDTAPQFNRWREDELVNWLNDGQLAIAKYLPAAFSDIYTVKTRPGSVQTIDTIAQADWRKADGTAGDRVLYGVSCQDFLNNMGTDGATPGDALPPPVSRKILDQQRPGWHTGSGPVVRQVIYDPKLPRQYLIQPPAPAANPPWVRVGLVVRPALVTGAGTPETPVYNYAGSNATLISLNDEFVDDLVNYICARAYMKNAEYTADPTKAAQFANLFISQLNGYVAALTGTNPNLKRLPMAPEPIGAAS